jgi:cell wall-associated NlpC family hydrolase
MEYGLIKVPAAPLRKRSRHQVEMVSQLLFGEKVEILKSKKNGWVKVKSLHDNYEGWLTENLLTPATADDINHSLEFVAADLVNKVAINDQVLNIPVGSSLPFFNNGKGRLGEIEFSYAGNSYNLSNEPVSPERLISTGTMFLNAPYMWGGRTILGIDCSGFVQVCFKMIGIDLPRDAWQQAQTGTTVKKLKEADMGDLVFFDDKDEIVHVGVLISNEQVLHASGKVRIDRIDKKGIINTETGKRTHKLEAIRRLL